MEINTLLARAGTGFDPTTGAISMPVYQCATFAHPALGQSTGFDYSRSANPTRSALESTFAAIEGGAGASAFASGLAAIDAVLRLFAPGDKIVVTEDIYGGSVRLFEQFHKVCGIEPLFVDTTDLLATEKLLALDGVKAIFIEVPTNPLLKVADVSALAAIAKRHDRLVIVDNTFLTPVFFRPFEYGADITVYSATKYIGGHNDVVAGLAVAKDKKIAERIAYVQNATGAILGPQDSWLILRGLKTLALRLKVQESNAKIIADYLLGHKNVRKVYYPGIEGTQSHRNLRCTASGYGAMLAFEVDDFSRVERVLSGLKIISFAESLGGVESLITFPSRQTHADIDEETRERLGINDRLLRLSVGIESINDLLADLAGVLD